MSFTEILVLKGNNFYFFAGIQQDVKRS